MCHWANVRLSGSARYYQRVCSIHRYLGPVQLLWRGTLVVAGAKLSPSAGDFAESFDRELILDFAGAIDIASIWYQDSTASGSCAWPKIL